jgi:hypothetical protein
MRWQNMAWLGAAVLVGVMALPYWVPAHSVGGGVVASNMHTEPATHDAAHS